MSDTLTVIPVITRELADKCIESILMDKSASGIAPEDILIVDNTRNGLPADYYGLRKYRDPDGHNIGVPRAWNIGAREVTANPKLEYLTIMSASMLFGPEKETTWTKQMHTFWGANCIESDGHSWHLIAFHRRVFDLIGYFDENFYPGYFEAIDFGYRLRMLNMEGGWPRVWVNALSQAVGHHTDMVLATPLLEYYRDKWGGDKGEEKYVLPWGGQPMGYFPEHSIPQLAHMYGLELWW